MRPNPDPARPRIGITCDVRVEARSLAFVFEPYVRRVEEAGGVPLAIAPLMDPSAIPRLLEAFDGIVIVGGEDVDPRLYGEEPLPTHEPLPPWRERFDLALARALLDSDIPVLGICYGCQLLAVTCGGALWQDIPSQVPASLPHAGHYPNLPHHSVEIAEGTRLRELLGVASVRVNSSHHQAPKRLGASLRAAAVAPDGVVEAFEGTSERFLLGVQWHPELGDDEASRKLFAALVDAARRRSGAVAAR